MPSALLRQTLSGRSAPLLILIAALSIFLAYAPTAQAQASTDANLSALTLEADGQPLTLTPSFSSGDIAYTASVDSSVPWLTVTPTANDPGATITVDTPVLSAATPVDSDAASPLLLLNTGANAIAIVVTAADGSTKTYTVTVTRPNAGCGASTGIDAAQTRLLAECATLLGLKDELVGSGTDLNWAANVDIASWEGIRIRNDRIDRLHLKSIGLAGVIPPELASLTGLERLYLYGKQLTGSIPPELGNLTDLINLNLRDNNLTGSIPPELGDLTNLISLDLSGNNLTGSIPPELGDLKDLEDLYLFDNNLTGSIPPELGNLVNLQHLVLGTNTINIGGNNLTGSIPPKLGDLTNLQHLVLGNNQLTGSIPPELGDLTNLTYLYLHDNNLTGSIPPELGNLPRLRELFLYNNQLTGSIPPELGDPEDLYYLFLNNNQLTGSIPPQLGNLTNLSQLGLARNQLTGRIPPELGDLTNLWVLYLHCNELTGGIPTELAASDRSSWLILELQGNPLDSVVIPVGLTAMNVRLSGAANKTSLGSDWCGPPAFADSSATRTVVEGTASGQAIGDPVEATDPDNRPIPNTQPLTYTLGGADASHFAIDSATGQLSVGSAALDYDNPADANTDNDYELTVTASDGVAADKNGGSDSIDVTVRVTRRAAPRRAVSTDADLSALTLQVDGQTLTLTPAFTSANIAYTASVAGSVPWLTVTPTVSDSGATITVNTPVLSAATAVDSDVASPLLLLNTGANAIEVEVTAADGSTKTYTVTVTRADGGCGASTGIDAAQTRLLADCATLLGLKDELRGTAALNWAANVAITSWEGIHPDFGISGNRIVDLALGYHDLTGVIPPELGSLSRLTRLHLGNNQLTGSIPSQLGNLTRLASLYLSVNRLTGSIPPELGSLTNLTDLDLHANRLTGGIPKELGSLTSLFNLHLDNNELTGSIPPELGDLKGLYYLYLDNNDLTGSIPRELGSLTSLEDLQLNNNRLTGNIPPELGAPEDLYYLYLNDNQLTGSIPPQLGNLIYLEELDLSDNQLTGLIPVQLGNLTSLDSLWLHCNGLTGGIPTELAALDGKLDDGLWLQGNPLNSVAIPMGLTAGKVRLSGAKGSWDSAVWCGPPAFPSTETGQRSTTEGPQGRNVGAPVAATDPDNRPIPNTQSLTYTLGGTDASHFTIDGATGQLRVGSAALDYDNPADANTDNDYELTVTASDGVAADKNGGSDSIDVTVRVTRAAALSTDATLSGLTISAGTLSPTFTSAGITYTASVANSVTGVTVTPTANHAGATITVNTGAVTSGSASGSQSLNVGANTITIIVTAQDGSTTRTYTVTVTRAASTDATLSGLTISAGTLAPAFTSAGITYTASVGNSVTGVTVTPTANHAGATITVNTGAVTSGSASGSQSLNVGANTITIIVTAQDGSTKKTYTVTVTRAAAAASTDATLSGLTISAGTLAPAFTSAGITYTASVGNSVTGVTVTPTANHTGATIKVAGTTVASGVASGSQSLNVGANAIAVEVTAQDGSTKKTYTVTVTRAASTDATLSGLTISAGTLAPAFTSAGITYTASVGNSVTSVTVTPTANHAGATITVAGTTVASGVASGSQSLNVGANAIAVEVTAQDGSTKKTYTVTVTRAASTDATLSGLTISAGTLAPTFTSNTLIYSASVGNIVSGVTVTPTANHTGATIRVAIPGSGSPVVASGQASPVRSLVVGLNTVRIVVTAEDGSTQKVYDVKFTRAASTDAALSGLTISAGTLAPTFTSNTLIYSASVGNSVTGVTVTPTANHAGATIRVTIPGSGSLVVASGQASPVRSLVVGLNTVRIVVTAEDGSTQKVYDVKFTRAASTDATLSGLTISAGALTPAFTSAGITYTASVGNSVSGVTVTPTANHAGATITVAGTTVASGVASGSQSLNVGANAIAVEVTAQDGSTKKTYTVTVTRAASTDATLSGLTISAGALAPAFTSAGITYTASVGNSVTGVTVTPTANHTGATIKVAGTTVASGAASGSQSLNVGANAIPIEVTAEDGSTKKTYTVTVTRAASTDATLSGLTISAGALAPAFTSAGITYTASVGNSVTGVTVTPTANHAGATITVNTGAVTSGSASGSQSLNVGANTITIVVTAQDGSTKKTYTVTVTRAASTDATLSGLTISAGALTPAFTSAGITYTASVGNSVTGVTVTPTANHTGATIKVAGTTVASGAASGSQSLNVGANAIPIEVTAEDGSTKKTYTVTVTRAASTDATLSGLTISAGALAPAFTSAGITYTASVGNSVSGITVTPTANHAGATITVNTGAVTSGSASGSQSLNVGANTITIVVTAQDGSTTRTYTVTVTRAAALSTDATLSGLTISAGALSPAFTSAGITYTASVGNSVTGVTVTPTANHAGATITVNTGAVTSGSASGSQSLNVGANTITIVVTAQDGSTTRTYTVTVTRAAALSTDATLSGLTISAGALSPAFTSAGITYTASVGNSVTGVTVTPTANHAGATITVNTGAVTSGSASGSQSLNVGANTITIVVTAQDGSTKKTYTVTVTRAAALSTDATLSGLTISAGALSPAFTSAGITYTASVGNSVSGVTVTPTANHAGATITVNTGAVTSGSASGSQSLNAGGDTDIVIEVTAQDGSTKKTYTVTVTRAAAAASTDATLSGLTISAGALSPAFTSAGITYTVSVGNSVTGITVTSTANHAGATITVNTGAVTSGSASGSQSLNAGGDTDIVIEVTAQDGSTKKTYTVTVTRAAAAGSTDATLSGLIISHGALSPSFDKDTYTYDVSLPFNIDTVTITPTANDPNATIRVAGDTVASGRPCRGQRLLFMGMNTIDIVVTAEDGATTETYTVRITRTSYADASGDTTLSGLTIDQLSYEGVSRVTLTPAFHFLESLYTASVGTEVTSVIVTPTANDPNATIRVAIPEKGNVIVPSGSASPLRHVVVGLNTIIIKVTAEDGTSRTYRVRITRIPRSPALSNDATLSGLTVSPGTLSQGYLYKGGIGYNVDVPNRVSSVTLTPTAKDPSATITVGGATVVSGNASTPQNLAEGGNTILIAVTAEDGETKMIYSIFVVRARAVILSTEGRLRALTISDGALNPPFIFGRMLYSVEVANSVDEVTVTPTVQDPNATIKVRIPGRRDVSVASGAVSPALPLNVGLNTIRIIVTAEDTEAPRMVYRLEVTRASP